MTDNRAPPSENPPRYSIEPLPESLPPLFFVRIQLEEPKEAPASRVFVSGPVCTWCTITDGQEVIQIGGVPTFAALIAQVQSACDAAILMIENEATRKIVLKRFREHGVGGLRVRWDFKGGDADKARSGGGFTRLTEGNWKGVLSLMRERRYADVLVALA